MDLFARRLQETPESTPKRAQEHSKSAQERPESAPRSPKERLRAPQERPMEPQEHPKSPQDALQDKSFEKERPGQIVGKALSRTNGVKSLLKTNRLDIFLVNRLWFELKRFIERFIGMDGLSSAGEGEGEGIGKGRDGREEKEEEEEAEE